jgi:hypothetical protein
MRLRWLVPLATVVLLLPACGGNDGGGGERLTKSEYEEEIASLGEAVASSFDAVGEAGSPDELGDQLDEARGALDDLAGQLDELAPPEDIEAAHDRLVTSLRDFSDDLEEVAGNLREALEGGDPSAALAVLGELSTLESVAALQQVQQEFQEKGYDLGEASGLGG